MTVLSLNSKRTFGFVPDLTTTHGIAAFPILMVFFATMEDRNLAAEVLYKERDGALKGLKMAEVMSNLELMFLDITQCMPSATVTIRREKLQRIMYGRLEHAYYHTDYEFRLVLNTQEVIQGRTKSQECSPIRRGLDTTSMLQMVIVSWDIEAVSETLEFPNPLLKNDQIVCIATSAYNTRTKQTQHFAHTLTGVSTQRQLNISEDAGGEEDIPLFELSQYETEAELIEGWRDLIVIRLDCDVVMGWNSSTFDWNYLLTRLTLLKGKESTSRGFCLSRRISVRSTLQRRSVTTAAHGTRESCTPNLEGRINVDLMDFVAKRFKFESYALNHVADKLVSRKKVDLPPKTMMQAWLSGDQVQRRRVVAYCVRDTILPLEIWKHLRVREQTIQLSRVSSVFYRDIFSRGELWPSFCMLLIFAHANGYFLNERPGEYRRPTWRLKDEAQKKRDRGTERLLRQTGRHLHQSEVFPGPEKEGSG
jgi:DNA polymerase elongation subunit (family B)